MREGEGEKKRGREREREREREGKKEREKDRKRDTEIQERSYDIIHIVFRYIIHIYTYNTHILSRTSPTIAVISEHEERLTTWAAAGSKTRFRGAVTRRDMKTSTPWTPRFSEFRARSFGV